MLKLLTAFILAISLHSIAGECPYEYTTHPNVRLNCDPEGSRLQLHCAVRGSLTPAFQLHWYMGPRAGGAAVVQIDSNTNQQDYEVNTVTLNSKGDLPEICQINSTLRTPRLTPSHANQCIWCAVEFRDLDLTLSSNDSRLCLDTNRLLPQCDSDEGSIVLSNPIAVCATLTIQQQEPLLQTTAGASGSPPPSVTIDTTGTTTDPIENTIGATTTQGQTAGETTMTLSPPLTTPTTPTTPTQTAASTTPISTPAGTTPPTSTTPSSEEPTPPRRSTIAPTVRSTAASDTTTTTSGGTNTDGQGSVEGELFVAIAICIVFIVIIIILMSIVICLFRQWKWKREKEARRNEDEIDSTYPNQGRPSPAPPVIVRGYSVDRFQVDPDALFLRTLEDELLTTRSMQDLSHHQLAPPIPPRPQRMLKASSASALNYRGRGLIHHGYNNFTLERPKDNSPDSTIPPPIPVRSKSRDHFYHTLEYNNTNDSGLALSSPQHSRQSSSLDSIREQEEPSQPSLFDDPRYVVVEVEGEEGQEEEEEREKGEGHLRKGMWSSTPSLNSTTREASSNGIRVEGGGGGGDRRVASSNGVRVGGGEDRRSLRLTHVVGTQIYN